MTYAEAEKEGWKKLPKHFFSGPSLEPTVSGEEKDVCPACVTKMATALANQPIPLETGFRVVSVEVVEREHILATLEQTKWNKSQAAHILGIERSTLDRKLKKYEVERPKA